jgi:T5SS/PEP-CTERM-associated repeat protein
VPIRWSIRLNDDLTPWSSWILPFSTISELGAYAIPQSLPDVTIEDDGTVAAPAPEVAATNAGLTTIAATSALAPVPEDTMTVPAAITGGDFSNPQPVTILGYSGNEMEPFISRDGQYLFFNDSNDPPNDTNLFYATRINDTTFSFVGEIQGVNTNDVDAVSSMDASSTFYYFSRSQYFTTYLSLYAGIFNNGTVTDVQPIDQNIAPDQYGGVNIDSEISPNGQTLYYTDSFLANIHDRSEPLLSSEIEEAVLTPDGFEEIPNSDAIFKNINNADLNYAPSVSADGLTLFFTRLDLAAPSVRIYVATRASTSDPFGVPQLVQAASGYVEGPSLSSDGTLLYYHKQLPDGTFQIYVASLAPAGTIVPRTLVWSGAIDTNFANQQNWNDSTNSLSPAGAPPDSADTAVVVGFGGTIAGTGSVDALVFGGADTWALSSTASLVASSGLIVGLGGSATLTVDAGASISSQGIQDIVTGASGQLASVTVDGAGSSWNSAGELVVGNNGAGAFPVSNQGTVISGGNSGSPGGGLTMALGAGSSSAVTVTGAGSAIVNAGQLSIGGGDGVPIGGMGTPVGRSPARCWSATSPTAICRSPRAAA